MSLHGREREEETIGVFYRLFILVTCHSTFHSLFFVISIRYPLCVWTKNLLLTLFSVYCSPSSNLLHVVNIIFFQFSWRVFFLIIQYNSVIPVTSLVWPLFLVACRRLYESLRRSVCLSVCPAFAFSAFFGVFAPAQSHTTDEVVPQGVGVTGLAQTFASGFCIIAPAQSHATDVVVYPALF